VCAARPPPSYEADNPWEQDLEKKRKWCEALENLGPDIVRDILKADPHGSRASIPIGECFMTKGYAQTWLAWHDRKKAERETAFRTNQIRWPKWAAIVVTISAVGGLLAWMIKNL
jgi:hypothetical protein